MKEAIVDRIKRLMPGLDKVDHRPGQFLVVEMEFHGGSALEMNEGEFGSEVTDEEFRKALERRLFAGLMNSLKRD